MSKNPTTTYVKLDPDTLRKLQILAARYSGNLSQQLRLAAKQWIAVQWTQEDQEEYNKTA